VILFVDVPLASLLPAEHGACRATIRLDGETWPCTAHPGHHPPHVSHHDVEEDGHPLTVIRVAWTLEECAECGGTNDLTAEEDTEICAECKASLDARSEDQDSASNLADRIEILAYRDPDGDTDIVVRLDGNVLNVPLETIDPGAGASRADWREHTEAVAGNPSYSPEFRAAVVEVRNTAEADYLGEFITDDGEAES